MNIKLSSEELEIIKERRHKRALEILRKHGYNDPEKELSKLKKDVKNELKSMGFTITTN